VHTDPGKSWKLKFRLMSRTAEFSPVIFLH